MSEPPGLGLWIRLLLKHYRFIGGVSLLAGVLTLIVVLLLPKWYEAQASILPPHEDTPDIKRLDELGAALQLERFLPFTEQVSLGDVYLAILDSDTVARSLIERFDLKEHYKQRTVVKTMKALRAHSTISPTRKRIFVVKVEDKDPEMAAALANAYLEELDRIFRETRSSAGKRQRLFLERRLDQARAELDSAEIALAEVQKGKGVTVLSRNLSEAAMAAGDLLGKRLALTVQLEMMKEMGITSSPARRALELELRAVEIEAAKLPILGLDVAQRIRDLRIREFLYEELIKQLEAARIEEARDTPAVEVLDVAIPPDRHKRPRKGLASIAGVFVGFALAFVWTVYRESEA